MTSEDFQTVLVISAYERISPQEALVLFLDRMPEVQEMEDLERTIQGAWESWTLFKDRRGQGWT